jgi:2-desacetyl-2-hydroxyethyl bacteriochlorophyllide A dehydrogenase
MPKTLMLYGPRDIRYEERPLPALGPVDVHLRTRMGAISSGTEAAWYFGSDPQLQSGFRPGRVGLAQFPRMLGYEKVADVVAVGSEVSSLEVGQRVVGHYGHAEEIVRAEDKLFAVPDEVSDEQAVAYSLAAVALHGIRRSRLLVGDDLFVTGLGFIGLLTVKLGRLAGAGRIIGTDPYELRRAYAIELGADAALDPTNLDVAKLLKEQHESDGFDVAIETSSSYDAVCDAMAALRRNGRLCVVSQLKGQHSSHPVFGTEFHLGELEMISADGRGDARKSSRWFFETIRRGSLDGITDLITHRVPFSEIERGFELLEQKPEEVVKIAVTYDCVPQPLQLERPL